MEKVDWESEFGSLFDEIDKEFEKAIDEEIKKR